MAIIIARSNFQCWTYFKILSYSSSNWTKLEMNLFEYFQNTWIHSKHLLNEVSWIYSTQIDPNLITKKIPHSIILSEITHAYIYLYPFNSYASKWTLLIKIIPCVSHDHPIAICNSSHLQTTKYSNQLTTNIILHLYLLALWTLLVVMALGQY